MAQVKLLPVQRFSQLAGLFQLANGAEGTLAWFQTLADSTLEDDEKCFLAVAKDDVGTIGAALPLIRGRNAQLRALTAPYTTVYTPPLVAEGWARYLGRNAPAFVSTVLRLDAVDLTDPIMSAFVEGLAASPLAHVTFSHFANWFEQIPNFESYWSMRPTRLKTTVRRKLASIRKHHKLEFRFAATETDLASALGEYFQVYRSSWKPAEPHPDFITAMVRNLTLDGIVRIATLLLDDAAVASQIWLLKDGKATIFKLAHREQFTHLSPGTLLTHWMLETVCRTENVSEVDFGRGDDAYKRDWLNSVRMRHGLIAANSGSIAGLVAIFREIYPTRLNASLKSLRRLSKIPN